MIALQGAFFCIISIATAAAFRPRGIAPYSNSSSITTGPTLAISTTQTILSPPSSSSSPSSRPPYPIFGSGTGVSSELGYPSSTEPGSAAPSASSNRTLSNDTKVDPSCTVNIPSASLEWWYAATYAWPLGTFTNYADNWTNPGGYLTLMPNTETFDVSSAISTDIVFTAYSEYDADWDVYWTYFDQYTVIPTAAATSLITRNAAVPLPSGNIIPETETDKYMLDWDNVGTASAVIASSANSTSAITSATPVLVLTAYEVESAGNGTTATETVTLPQPQAYEYWVKGIESSASATGSVPDEFLQQIPQSSCAPGLVQGTVTVLVVVDIFYFQRPRANPFLVHFESTALGFDDPGPVVILKTKESSKDQPFTMDFPLPTSEKPDDHPSGPKPTAEPPVILPNIQPTPPAHSHGGNGHGDSIAPNAPEPTQITVGTIGTNPVIVGPSSVVIVGTQTLQPGGPPVTVGGSSISLAPSATAIVVGGSTSSLPLVLAPTATVGTIASTPVIIGPSSVVTIGSQTLQPGGAPITVGGNEVSLAPSATAIIIGDKTSTLPAVVTLGDAQQTPARAPPVLTIGTSRITANAATQFLVAPGQTLTPGGTVQIDGTMVSLAPGASFVVVGGTTQILPTAPPSFTAPPAIVLGGSTITAQPGNPNDSNAGPTFVISGQTLTPNQAITVGGTTVSLAPSGSFIVVNGVTSTLHTAPATTPPPLTIGNSVFTALPGTGTTYQIGSAILTPGGIVILSGTTISLIPSATAIVVNGVTTTLDSAAHPMITNPPLLTIGDHTYTAAPGTGTTFVIDGQTLTPGGTITVDGTTISLAPGATALTYGSSGRTTTTALFPATTTRTPLTTTAFSAPASAGASGTGGGAAATSSVRGAGHKLPLLRLETCVIPIVLGMLSVLF